MKGSQCCMLRILTRRSYSQMQHAENTKLWDVFAAVALQRSAIIAPPMREIEKRYNEVMLKEEVEKSFLSDFELRQMRDERLLKKRAELKTEGNFGKSLDEEIGVLASTVEEEWCEERKCVEKTLEMAEHRQHYKTSEHVNEGKLFDSLVLIVRKRFGRNDGYISPWQLPMIAHESGETLKETAERCLKGMMPNSKISILSNAPFSVYSYKYPQRLKRRENDTLMKGSSGAVVFFFKALLTHKEVLFIRKDDIADYKWVTAEEFVLNVRSRRYISSLSVLFPSSLLCIRKTSKQ